MSIDLQLSSNKDQIAPIQLNEFDDKTLTLDQIEPCLDDLFNEGINEFEFRSKWIECTLDTRRKIKKCVDLRYSNTTSCGKMRSAFSISFCSAYTHEIVHGNVFMGGICAINNVSNVLVLEEFLEVIKKFIGNVHQSNEHIRFETSHVWVPMNINIRTVQDIIQQTPQTSRFIRRHEHKNGQLQIRFFPIEETEQTKETVYTTEISKTGQICFQGAITNTKIFYYLMCEYEEIILELLKNEFELGKFAGSAESEAINTLKRLGISRETVYLVSLENKNKTEDVRYGWEALDDTLNKGR